MQKDTKNNILQSTRFLFGLLDKKNKKFVQNFISILSIVVLFIYGITQIHKGEISDKDLTYFLVLAILGLGLTLLVSSRENNFVRIIIYILAFLVALPLLIIFWENTTGLKILSRSNNSAILKIQDDSLNNYDKIEIVKENLKEKKDDKKELQNKLRNEGKNMLEYIKTNNSYPSDNRFIHWKNSCKNYLKGSEYYNDTIFNLSPNHYLYNNKRKQIEEIMTFINNR